MAAKKKITACEQEVSMLRTEKENVATVMAQLRQPLQSARTRRAVRDTALSQDKNDPVTVALASEETEVTQSCATLQQLERNIDNLIQRLEGAARELGEHYRNRQFALEIDNACLTSAKAKGRVLPTRPDSARVSNSWRDQINETYVRTSKCLEEGIRLRTHAQNQMRLCAQQCKSKHRLVVHELEAQIGKHMQTSLNYQRLLATTERSVVDTARHLTTTREAIKEIVPPRELNRRRVAVRQAVDDDINSALNRELSATATGKADLKKLKRKLKHELNHLKREQTRLADQHRAAELSLHIDQSCLDADNPLQAYQITRAIALQPTPPKKSFARRRALTGAYS